MEQLVAARDMAACGKAVKLAAKWFDGWVGQGDVVEGEIAEIAGKAAAKARMEVAGGPAGRADAARWLLLDAATHRQAIRWINALCREFALGGAGGVSAAAALLAGVAPAALAEAGVEGGLSACCDAAEASGDDAVAADAAELRCWLLYYEYETEFASWQRIYEAAAAAAHATGDRSNLARLAEQTAPLLAAMVDFIASRALDALAVCFGDPAMAGSACEMALVVGPDAGPEASEEVQAGLAYPSLSPEGQAGTAAALLSALDQDGGSAGSLIVAAGPAPDDGSVSLPGLVSVAVQCRDGVAAAAAAKVLASALKGSTQAGPLIASNIDAPASISAELCRCVCYPRVASRAAARHEALAFMGHVGDEGAELVQVVAETDVAERFSKRELQELLQFMRAATVLLMRNEEAGSGGGEAAAGY
jgi:hypothetical protein